MDFFKDFFSFKKFFFEKMTQRLLLTKFLFYFIFFIVMNNNEYIFYFYNFLGLLTSTFFTIGVLKFFKIYRKDDNNIIKNIDINVMKNKIKEFMNKKYELFIIDKKYYYIILPDGKLLIVPIFNELRRYYTDYTFEVLTKDGICEPIFPLTCTKLLNPEASSDIDDILLTDIYDEKHSIKKFEELMFD